MTAAERQRKRRRRLRVENRARQIAEKRQANSVRDPEKDQRRYEQLQEWLKTQPAAQPPLSDRADEIALQIEEAIAADPYLTIEKIRAAIERRWCAHK